MRLHWLCALTGWSVIGSRGMILESPLRTMMVVNWAIGGVLQLGWGHKILMVALRFLIEPKKQEAASEVSKGKSNSKEEGKKD